MSTLNEKSKAFGTVLAKARKSAGISNQGGLADLLGMAKNTIWHYEAGRTLPDIDFLARFARATGTDLHQLLALRLDAAGEDPAILSVGEVAPVYEATRLDQSLRADRLAAFAGQANESLSDIAAAVRAQVTRANIPIAWSLLLVQLAAVGDLSANGAGLIIDLLTSEGVAGQDSNPSEKE